MINRFNNWLTPNSFFQIEDGVLNLCHRSKLRLHLPETKGKKEMMKQLKDMAAEGKKSLTEESEEDAVVVAADPSMSTEPSKLRKKAPELWLSRNEDGGTTLLVQANPVAMAAYFGEKMLVRDLLHAGYSWDPLGTVHFYRGIIKGETVTVEKELSFNCTEFYLLYGSLPTMVSGIPFMDVLRDWKKTVLFKDVFSKMQTYISEDFACNTQTDKDRDKLYQKALEGLEFALRFMLTTADRVGGLQVSVDLSFLRSRGNAWISMPYSTEVRPLLNIILLHYLEMIRRDMVQLKGYGWMSGFDRDKVEEIGEKCLITQIAINAFSTPQHCFTAEMIEKLGEYCEIREESKAFLLNKLMTQFEYSQTCFLADPRNFAEDYETAFRKLVDHWEITEHWMIRNVWGAPDIVIDIPRKAELNWFINDTESFAGTLVKIYEHPLVFYADQSCEMVFLDQLIKKMVERGWSIHSEVNELIDHVEGVNKNEGMWMNILSEEEPELLVSAVRKNLIPISKLSSLAEKAVSNGKPEMVPYLISMM